MNDPFIAGLVLGASIASSLTLLACSYRHKLDSNRILARWRETIDLFEEALDEIKHLRSLLKQKHNTDPADWWKDS